MLIPSSVFFGDLRRLFHHFDADGDGKISPAELQDCVKMVGEDLSSEDAEAIVRSSDSDGDRLLGSDDFAKLANGTTEKEDEEEEKGKRLWEEAFRVYAREEGEEGYWITAESLRRTLIDWVGKSMSVEECEVMIQHYDRNGDGVICFDEFKAMMDVPT